MTVISCYNPVFTEWILHHKITFKTIKQRNLRLAEKRTRKPFSFTVASEKKWIFTLFDLDFTILGAFLPQ